MKKLTKLITELESNLKKVDGKNEAISSGTIGWHLEHSLLTIKQIVNAVSQSDPTEYLWKFDFWRTVVLTSKKIPRGRAKAPEIVQPKIGSSVSEIEELLGKVKVSLIEFEQLPNNAFFKHPYFGKLNKKTTLRFLEVHTLHHLKIIRDVTESIRRN